MTEDEIRLSNVAVSELSDISEPYGGVEDGAYLLISQPRAEMTGGYISEKVKYSALKSQMTERLEECIAVISSEITDIYSNYIASLSGPNDVSIDSFEYPYVLSSIHEYNGRIVGMRGYRFAEAMAFVFRDTMFQQICAYCMRSVDLYSENASVSSLDAAAAEISVLNAVSAYVTSCDAEPAVNSTNVLNSGALYGTMRKYFMDGYSSSNQLAHKSFVNSSINNVAAYQVTKQGGESIFTHAELMSMASSDFWSGSYQRCPTRNDYCFILSDETRPDPGFASVEPTTRYIYNGLSSGDEYDPAKWTYQYTVNNTPFTAQQWQAVNSGIRSTSKVTRDDSDETKLSCTVGSETIPVYVLSTGQVAPITSYSGTADNAKNDSDGNEICSTYVKISELSNRISSFLSTILSDIIAPEMWNFEYEDEYGNLCSVVKRVWAENV